MLRIRQAEVALADGRLDEAFAALMGDEALRAHRRGQALATALAGQLLARGRGHLAAQRLEEARGDMDKAGRLAGNATDVAALRAELASQMLRRRAAAEQRASLLAEARRHIDQDRLSVGERLLGEMETSAAQPLRSQLDQRQRALDAAAAGIDEALARDDWSAAAAHLVAARQEGLRGAAIDERIGRLRQMLLARIAESFAAGRLDTAQIILEHLTSVDADSPHVQPWKKALAQCRRAAQAVQEGQPGRAAQTLRRLRTAMPEVPWLAGEIEHCEQAAAALDHLATGALGLLDWASGTGFGPVAVLRESSDLPECKATCGGQHGLEDDMSLPERLLIRVDGVGSFLVLRGQRVTLGPISSSARPDIAFLIDPSTPPVAIERAEEDYFLVTGGAAGGAVSRRLLTDGDKIDLSGRCRLRFSRPNAASTSALLELTAGRLGQSDTRKIILMDREILLGAGAAAHIRAEDLAEQAVLLVRDGRLACQTGQPVLINGKMAACPAALPLATPVRIGPVSLIVEQA